MIYRMNILHFLLCRRVYNKSPTVLDVSYFSFTLSIFIDVHGYDWEIRIKFTLRIIRNTDMIITFKLILLSIL